MQSQPDISIVVPPHNEQDWFAEAILKIRQAMVDSGRPFFPAVALLALILAVCPAGNCAQRQTIHMVAGQYAPSADMQPSAINRYPHNAIRRIAEDWEAMQSGYRIEFLNIPIGPNYIEWITAQCTAQTEPEIVFYFAGGQILAENGWAIALDPFFEKPNPHVEGNERWKDIFYPAVFAPQWAFPNDGQFYFAAVDMFESVIYCNLDIFEEAGLLEDGKPHQPEDWEDFFRMQERIRKAGYTPFWCPVFWSWWPAGVFGDMLYGQDILSEVDVLQPNGTIEADEIMRAVLLGIFSAEGPRYRAYLDIMKRWSAYWPKGFDLADEAGHIDPFMLGRQAMSWSSVWNIVQIMDDPLRDFDLGTIYFPSLTVETTPLATGAPPPAVGSPGTTYYVTKSSIRNGLLEGCIDWLMFLTSPANIERLTQEPTNVKYPPAVRWVDVDPSLEPIMRILELPRATVRIPTPLAYQQEWYTQRTLELFLMGVLSVDQAARKLDELLFEGAINSIYNNQEGVEHARWDLAEWGVDWEGLLESVEAQPRLSLRYGRFVRNWAETIGQGKAEARP